MATKERKNLKRISRAKADELVKGFLDRVKQVNDNVELPRYVSEAFLFGSYIRDSDTVGDIDIAVKLEFRDADSDPMADAQRRLDANGVGRRGNLVDFLFYPDREVFRLLQAGKRHISLHTDLELDRLKCERKRIFPAEEGVAT